MSRGVSPAVQPGDPGWSETICLAGGIQLRVRELRLGDADKLRKAFAELSPRSRYFRFLTPKTRLTDGELAYLTDLDGHDHFAVVALRLEPDGSEGEGIGIARAIRLPDAPDTSEIAVTVVDHMQGKGVGTALVTRLAAIASRRQVRRLRCELASSNTRALDVLHELAPTARVERDGPVTRVEVTLRPPTDA